jgi:hypothetical protein
MTDHLVLAVIGFGVVLLLMAIVTKSDAERRHVRVQDCAIARLQPDAMRWCEEHTP